MVLYANQAGHQVGVYTTLVGMKMEDIALLASVPFRFFKIHLPSDEGYEQIKVDAHYIGLLDRISSSAFGAEYHCHSKNLHYRIMPLIKENIQYHPTGKRADNLKENTIAEVSSYRCYPERFRGVIGCRRSLRNNVLLPSGDVSLCCTDFGLKHMLGNLLEMDYDDLFQSEEFQKIEEGLNDDSKDILCRYCEPFTIDVSLYAKICNYYKPMIYNIKNFGDVYRFVSRAMRKVGKLIRDN